MSERPKRIIVVDPSLRDNVGHHIEYDLSLIQGAAGEGVLDHHVLDPRRAQAPPQLGDARDVEPGEISEVQRGRAAQPTRERRHDLLLLSLGANHG